jgi:hypothetical protein
MAEKFRRFARQHSVDFEGMLMRQSARAWAGLKFDFAPPDTQ